MEVTVKLFANLRKYLPPESDGRKVVLKVPEGTTIREVASSLKVPEQLLQIVLVNGNNASLDESLSEGDEISIFPYMAGGAGQHV
jgi:molybdopterin converting factor small subunit